MPPVLLNRCGQIWPKSGRGNGEVIFERTLRSKIRAFTGRKFLTTSVAQYLQGLQAIFHQS